MGRGRQKAKQTKVARELKYFSPETDYDQLARELHAKSRDSSSPDDEEVADPDATDADDDYADWESSRR